MRSSSANLQRNTSARLRRALAVLAIVLTACGTQSAPESAKRSTTPDEVARRDFLPPPAAAPVAEAAPVTGDEGEKSARVAEEAPPPPAALAADKSAEEEPQAELETQRSAPKEKKRADAQGDSIDGLLDGALSGPSTRSRSSRNVTNSGLGSIGGRGKAATGSGYAAPARIAAPRIAAAAPVPVAQPATESNTERYAHAGDNPFEHVKDAPLSTFAIDVDTASYSNVRRFLREGVRPPIDAVRIEELVNYFHYDYPEPDGDDPVAVSSEISLAPWNQAHRLVRIGLRTREIAHDQAPPNNLVFLIDVSGSMQQEDKLPLLKRGLSMLAARMRPEDHVALVVYAGASGLVLGSTSGTERGRVLAALEQLEAGGSTNGGDGIRLAYEVARNSFVKGGVNRVVLATDGDFNVGTTSEGELTRLIEEERKSGIFLTVLGFGRGNLNDSGMEALADHGNGNYAYIDSIAEAHKVLVREAGSTLITVAKDVKLQIEWNPTRVQSYRLIGFENRRLAARDFNDDKKDAGELGAGHTVTALYEVVPTHSGDTHPEVDPLRYQAERAPNAAAASEELFSVKLRYKRPDGDRSLLFSRAVRDDVRLFEDTSSDFRWATAVAGFGMLLRDSEHKGDASLELVKNIARDAVGGDPSGERHELLGMISTAGSMGIGAQSAVSGTRGTRGNRGVRVAHRE